MVLSPMNRNTNLLRSVDVSPVRGTGRGLLAESYDAQLSNFPPADLTFKTAMQKRDPLQVKPARVGMWDMLTLQDTYNKKRED